jgi:hypothetical protein
MFEISLNGQARTVDTQAEVWAVADEMVKQAGGGVPAIREIAAVPVNKARPSGWDVKPEHVDADAKARVLADMAAARNAGFELKEPLFEAGTRVNEIGVENARSARLDFEAKPLVADAMNALCARVEAEQREDVVVESTALAMDVRGLIVAKGARFPMAERALKSLCARLDLPRGAGTYLSECWPELRAKNINNWVQAIAADEQKARAEAFAKNEKFEPALVALRTRLSEVGNRYVYATVSDSYAAYDIDQVAQAIALAMPNDARAEVHYNGRSAEILVHFHSTVQPEDYAAGEVFRAGLRFRTDDTGGGALKGFSFVEQNLCLNLIITNQAALPVFQLAHLGSVEKMAEKFGEGMKAAQDTVAPFMKQWGYARKDDLVAATVDERSGYEGIDITEIMQALLNGAIERKLVTVPGRREESIPKIVEAWTRDEGTDGPLRGTITRAGFVNALTRYAHEDVGDSWAAHEIERSASTLLWPTHKGGPLPHIPFAPLA